MKYPDNNLKELIFYKSINIMSKTIVVIILVFWITIPFSVVSQSNDYNAEIFLTIVSYNVENLFDTINNPDKEDDEFTPVSKKNWNTDRYTKKINDLAFVIKSINKNELPEIVSLIEVENKTVVKDLLSTKHLKEGGYAFVHEDSPDARGIDVAFAYRKSEFKYIEHQSLPVYYDFEPETTTRDILYVKGQLKNNEFLYFFVNHWSSRRKGKKESEPKRLVAAGIVRAKVDSILKKDKKAKIVILGDFNDEPVDKSLKEVLIASNNQKSINRRELFNVMYDKDLLSKGTYNYKGDWNMLDNIIVSQSLLHSKKGYTISYDGGQIFKEKWMMYDNVKAGKYTPSKTYGGPNYYGGVSDHFPVYIMLKQ